MDWTSIETGIPRIRSRGCLLKVRLIDKNEVYAYFYPDKMQWIADYGRKPCYFWDRTTKEPLHHVTHWAFIPGSDDELYNQIKDK